MRTDENIKAVLIKIMKSAVEKVVNNVELTPHDRYLINQQITKTDFETVLTDDILKELTQTQGIEISAEENAKKKESDPVEESRNNDPGGWERERLWYELKQARLHDERYTYQGCW